MKKYLLFTTLWWTVVFDWPFWGRIMDFYNHQPPMGFMVIVGIAFGFLTLAFLRLLAFLPFRVFQALMVILTLAGATAYCGSLLYGVPVTPDMMRNVMATDPHEASGYLSLKTIALFLAVALPPLIATFWLAKPIVKAPRRALKGLGWIAFSLVIALGAIGIGFQDFAGLFRGDRSLRYFLSPFNVVYSTIRTFTTDASPDQVRTRKTLDEHPTMTVTPTRPTVFVVVVGETTRSANWELAGYRRETTPLLKTIPDLISFPRVQSCGTSTDVSVPCMFSRVGHHNYDREQILAEEPLATVLQRAGFKVEWIENQGGCKGACWEVPNRRPTPVSEYCDNGDCLDGVFIREIDNAVTHATTAQPTVLFLHTMGSHGPAYYLRSPEADKAFKPECRDADLSSCSRESIVNAYDNSVRYTDFVLANMIKTLEAAHINAALVYVSDHGESLGENGLYLHGIPYMVAPKEQTTVPMVMWFSPEFKTEYGVNEDAIRAKVTSDDVSHDNLYHTVMGLLKVKGTTYERPYDLSAAP